MAEAWPGGVTGNSQELHPFVSQIVEYIWREAVGEIEEFLTVPIQAIKLEQVSSAIVVHVHVYYIDELFVGRESRSCVSIY